MTAELMVYAIVAAGLVVWLRSILGTRHEDEGEARPQSLEIDVDGKVVDLNAPARVDAVESVLVSLRALIAEPKGNMHVSEGVSEKVFEEVAKFDRQFDIAKFLQAAQDAFAFVVESFAEGDRETLRDLLGQDVYEAFDGAITAREKAGDVVSTEIQSIQKAELIEANLDGRVALMTVRFWAEEVSFTKNAEGEIVYGHPEKISQMRDVWTFSRDLRSRDPRWLVVETREDGDGDNEIIPNTH